MTIDGSNSTPHRANQPVGRENELRRGAECVMSRIERGANSTDDPAHPPMPKRIAAITPPDHTGDARREHEREREDHDASPRRNRGTRTDAAADSRSPPARRRLNDPVREAVRHDQRRGTEPLPDHVLGTRDRPREDGQRDPRLELARDGR